MRSALLTFHLLCGITKAVNSVDNANATYPNQANLRVKAITNPSIDELVSVDNINRFKFEHDLKADANLEMTILYNRQTNSELNDNRSNSNDVVIISNNGKEYLHILNDLKPLNIRTPSFTYMHNGEYYPNHNKETTSRMFERKDDHNYGDTIFVRKKVAYTVQDRDHYDDDDEVESITIIDGQNGTHTLFASIVPGVLVQMKPEYYKNYNDIYHYTQNNTIIVERNLREESVALQHNNNKRKRNLQECTEYKIIEVVIAYDHTYCAFHGDQAAADADVEAIIALASVAYEEQGVCAKVVLSSIEGYCDEASDPFDSIISTAPESGCEGNAQGVIQQFRVWLSDNRSDVERDAFHLFYAFDTPDNCVRNGGCGCANTDSMCRNSRGVENMIFTSIDEISRRAYLFAHELGHNVVLTHVDAQAALTGTDEAPLWIMEPAIGAGVMVWKQESIDALQAKLPTLDCLASGDITTAIAPTVGTAATSMPTPNTAATSMPTSNTAATSMPTSNTVATPTAAPPPVVLPTPGTDLEIGLQVLGTNLCLNVPLAAVEGRSNKLKVWDCKENFERQRFRLEASTGRIRLVALPTMCLTLEGSQSRLGKVWNGAPILIKSCGDTNKLSKQFWSWETSDSDQANGQLRSEYKKNKCMKGSTGRKKNVRVQRCSEEDNYEVMFTMIDSRIV